MSGFHPSDSMPKLGCVTDLREQWLVRADGALAHRLQDREISSHLCENRYRNQQIREDFPVALSEQRGIDNEAQMRDYARLRQAEIDAEIAREMAEINLRKQRRHSTDLVTQPISYRVGPMEPIPEPTQTSRLYSDPDPDELGLSPSELEELRQRMEQEERDARLARELSHEAQDHDILLADMRCAVEAQDGELARLLQEREYKKLQRAKEKARQKALLKKQQRLAAQQQIELSQPPASQATLCDAYSNPRDMIRGSGLRLSKSVDSDLNYVEPFEKEHIQCKASALQAKEISKQYYSQQSEPGTSNTSINPHRYSESYDSDKINLNQSMQHRLPPPPPTSGKKPRFPDPVSIRPASHYPADITNNTNTNVPILGQNYTENNNMYSSTYPPDITNVGQQHIRNELVDPAKRLSIISEITAEGLAKRQSKQTDIQKKRKGCKIQ